MNDLDKPFSPLFEGNQQKPIRYNSLICDPLARLTPPITHLRAIETRENPANISVEF